MQTLPVNLLRATILLTVVGGILVAPMIARGEREFMLLIFGALALAFTALPIFLRRDYNLFEPVTFISGLVLTGVTAKLIYIVAVGQDRPFIIRLLLLYHEPAVLLYGTIVLAIGLLAMVVGYSMNLSRAVPQKIFMPNLNNWQPGRMYTVMILLFVFSGICFAGFIVTAGVNASSLENLSAKRFSDAAGSSAARINSAKYYLYRGAALSKFVFYIALAWSLFHRKALLSPVSIVASIALVQTMALSFVMSSRASIVLILLDGLVIYYLMRDKIEIRRIMWAGVVSFGLLVVMLSSRDASDHTMGDLVEKTFAGRDLLDVSKSAHIINAVPDKIEYRYGETLYGFLVAPVPRSMWEDKPMWAERGPYLMQHVFFEKAGISGIQPGLLAELYWNFGWAGVVIGSFLMGIFLRQLYLTFASLPRTPTSVLIYTVIVTRVTIFSYGNDFGTGFVKSGLDLIPMCAMFFFFGFGVQPEKNNATSSIDGEAGSPHLGTVVPSGNPSPMEIESYQ